MESRALIARRTAALVDVEAAPRPVDAPAAELILDFRCQPHAPAAQVEPAHEQSAEMGRVRNAVAAVPAAERNAIAPMIITKYFAGTGKRNDIRICRSGKYSA